MSEVEKLSPTEQADVRERAGKLTHSERNFIRCLAYFGGETFVDDEGDQRAAQRLERAGLGYVSAWSGGWSFCLNDDGLQVRAFLKETQNGE